MEILKKIAIVAVVIICATLSFLIGYFMADNIPIEHISIINAICMLWSSFCSGMILGIVAVRIVNYIRFK